MNVGFIFIILFAVCAATIGMVFVAANAPSSAPVDSYSRTVDTKTNLTQGNVTSVMPVGINIMGYIAIIVGFLSVCVIVGYIVVAGNRCSRSHR